MNMQWMRDRSSSALVVLLFGIIIVVFAVEFGPGSRGLRSGIHGEAGKVNGEVITTGEWSFYYNQLFAYYQRFDPSFNNEKAEQFKLKDKAFDQIVDRMLLAQTGEKLGLAVSKKEVGKDIVNNPSFHEEGKFDKDLYGRTVNYYYRMSVPRYEEKHQKDMMGNRIQALLSDGPVLSENFMFEEWKLDNEKLNLEFVKFDTAVEAAKITVTDAEAKEFAARETEKLQNYFDNHKSNYETSEQVTASHILVRVDEKARPDELKKAEKLAADIAVKAKADAVNFLKVGEEFSANNTNVKGSSLGTFERGRMIKEFEDAVFAMEPGVVSDPIKTRFGYHIIKLEEKKPAQKKTLDDVRDEIARILVKDQKAKEIVRKQADAFLAALLSGKTFEELLPKADESATSSDQEKKDDSGVLKLEETGPFARGGGNYVPKIGASEELVKSAWDLTAEKPLMEKVLEVGDNFYVVRMREHRLPTREEFQSAKATEKERQRDALGMKTLEAWVKAEKAKATVVSNTGTKLFQEDDNNF